MTPSTSCGAVLPLERLVRFIEQAHVSPWRSRAWSANVRKSSICFPAQLLAGVGVNRGRMAPIASPSTHQRTTMAERKFPRGPPRAVIGLDSADSMSRDFDQGTFGQWRAPEAGASDRTQDGLEPLESLGIHLRCEARRPAEGLRCRRLAFAHDDDGVNAGKSAPRCPPNGMAIQTSARDAPCCHRTAELKP